MYNKSDQTYILIDKKPKPYSNLTKWQRWMESSHRTCTVKKNKIGDVIISTMFTGINSSYIEEEAPLLFETMIFFGEHDGYTDKYATWEQAEAGHEIALNLVKNEKK